MLVDIDYIDYKQQIEVLNVLLYHESNCFFPGQQVHIEMNEAETARDATPSPDAEELNIMAKIGPFLFKYGIFILILLLKVLYTHRCGK